MVEVRSLTTLEEAEAALGIAVATWGDHQLPPRELLRAFQGSGNLLQGAFVDGGLAGFSLAFFGKDEEGFHLHSHMLAVLPDLRGNGIGYALKTAQRDAAQEAGVRYVRWTFDPLIARNAYLNLTKLGAVCDSFEREFYGKMEDDLNAGDRSDRLWVRWDVGGERFAPPPGGVIVLDRSDDERPVMGDRPAPGESALVRIPREYPALRESDPLSAQAWRDATAEAFQACFGAGLIAVGFDPDSSYLFA